MYGQSQYVRLDPLQNLPDEYLYSLAAWKYINGENPAIFNADQPPLGKYIIGSGIKLFGNEKITAPIFVLLTLFVFFLLTTTVLRSKVLGLLATTVFSFEKLLLVQMKFAPLLDIYQLFFILLSLLFAVQSFRRFRYFILTMIAVGCVMGTKYFATGIVLLIALFCDTLVRILLEVHTQVKKKKQTVLERIKKASSFRRLLYLTATAPVSVITLLLIYLPAYWQGYSPKMILGVQRYIYEFHSQKIHFSPIDVWQLLLLNRWHVPWDNTIRPSSDWQFTWPLITIGAVTMVWLLIRSHKKVRKQKNAASTPHESLQLLAVWSVIYISTLMMSNLLPRYVLPLLPSLCILSFFFLQSILQTPKSIP